MTRLQYAAGRAEKQYNHVDPENRLIAATLEKKWEEALAELTPAQTRLQDALSVCPQAAAIPPELRDAFTDAGQRLPDLWPKLGAEAQKKLLRTLIQRVNLQRDGKGVVALRIVWRGGMVTEKKVRVPMASFRFSDQEAKVLVRIRELADQGLHDTAIAARLHEDGFYPCRGDAFTALIVQKLRLRNGILLGMEKTRRGELPSGYYTINELACKLKINASWFSREIAQGRLVIQKDPYYRCYLFPKKAETIERLKKLRKKEITQASFPKGAQ